MLINKLYQNEIFSNLDVWLCWIVDQVKVLGAKYSKQEANALAQEMKFILELSPVSHGQMAPPLQSGTPWPNVNFYKSLILLFIVLSIYNFRPRARQHEEQIDRLPASKGVSSIIKRPFSNPLVIHDYLACYWTWELINHGELCLAHCTVTWLDAIDDLDIV